MCSNSVQCSIDCSVDFIFSILPAMSWPPEDGYSHHARDFYDFRSSNWFVEAATSPKDLVILLDDSDDLSSSYWRLAKATVSGLLDTLGPNDFVNVYRYSDTVSEIHQCYTKILAQVCNSFTLFISLLFGPLPSPFPSKSHLGNTPSLV